ncbi:MAG: alpha/beta fold hydrolase [Limnochordaceae bacterium]|nr:alpha/beta fold hydrolase [Limnochordaceae bacterium]
MPASPGRIEEEPIRIVVEGQQLIGIVHRPPGGADERPPAVVLCHGFGGHKAENHRLFVKAARAMARAGMAALRFDFRGSGDSEGEFEEMTLSGEVTDALAALAYARSHVGRPVALLGMSMGGAVATLVAERDGDVARSCSGAPSPTPCASPGTWPPRLPTSPASSCTGATTTGRVT